MGSESQAAQQTYFVVVIVYLIENSTALSCCSVAFRCSFFFSKRRSLTLSQLLEQGICFGHLLKTTTGQTMKLFFALTCWPEFWYSFPQTFEANETAGHAVRFGSTFKTNFLKRLATEDLFAKQKKIDTRLVPGFSGDFNALLNTSFEKHKETSQDRCFVPRFPVENISMWFHLWLCA